IQSADRKTLSAILTFYVRQERFCDGAWAEAMEEGIFLQILQRLQQLSSS
ncbi:MAG TPA: hypothetical protein GX699_01280, partial [Firmicutes bacterium]|nr:hypothetical protein [Bacillota bacterium]